MSENPSTLQVKVSTSEVIEANLLSVLFQYLRFSLLETSVKNLNLDKYPGKTKQHNILIILVLYYIVKFDLICSIECV